MRLFIQLLFFFYVVMIISFYYGWKKIQPFNLEAKSTNLTVSVVVAVRNEEENINYLIKNLKSQDYNSTLFDIIIIDDHSIDNTLEILKNEKIECSNLKISSLEKGYIGKKQAILKAVKLSSSDIILTTDADCKFSNSWISNMVNKFSNSDINLISGPVAYHLEDNVFGNMQSLEFLSLVGSGASCIGLNKPIFCNAANMAYRRDVFLEVNDYKKNNVFSGDDVFLLHQIKNKYKGSTLFLKSFESIVYTTPLSNVKDFINQRIRWASKSNSYKDFDSIIVALLVFLINLSLVMLLLFSPFSFFYFEYFISFFIVKLFCDYIFLKPILLFFKKNDLIKLIFPLQIIYPFYITLITVLSNLFSFNWKGRIQKK